MLSTRKERRPQICAAVKCRVVEIESVKHVEVEQFVQDQLVHETGFAIVKSFLKLSSNCVLSLSKVFVSRTHLLFRAQLRSFGEICIVFPCTDSGASCTTTSSAPSDTGTAGSLHSLILKGFDSLFAMKKRTKPRLLEDADSSESDNAGSDMDYVPMKKVKVTSCTTLIVSSF